MHPVLQAGVGQYGHQCAAEAAWAWSSAAMLVRLGSTLYGGCLTETLLESAAERSWRPAIHPSGRDLSARSASLGTRNSRPAPSARFGDDAEQSGRVLSRFTCRKPNCKKTDSGVGSLSSQRAVRDMIDKRMTAGERHGNQKFAVSGTAAHHTCLIWQRVECACHTNCNFRRFVSA